MAGPGKTEIMTPAGIVTLDEGEHIELLEALCQVIDRKLKSGKDADTAHGLELIQIYDKLNCGEERVIPRNVEKDLEVAEIVKTLRCGTIPARKRRK